MRNKYYGRLLLSIIIVVILSFYNLKNFIALENPFMMTLSYTFATGLVYFLIHILENIIQRKYNIKLMVLTCIYAVFIWGVARWAYPAVISGGDMISIWNKTVIGDVEWHYMYLTSVFHIAAKLLFPAVAGPMMVQAIFLILFAAHFANRIHRVFNISYLWGFIPFLLQPVVFYGLYPNRMPLFSMLYAFFFSEMILDYKEKAFNAKKEIVYIILGAVLATWRKECIFLVIIIPFVIAELKHGVISFKAIWRNLIVILVLSLIIMLPQKLNYNPPSSQQLGTILIGYLTAMSYDGYDFDNTEDKACLDVIREYISLEKIETQVEVLGETCLGEVYGNFGEHYAWIKDKGDGEIDFNPFYKACIELFVRNPISTIKARGHIALHSFTGKALFADGNPTAVMQGYYLGVDYSEVNMSIHRGTFNYWFSNRIFSQNDVEYRVLSVIKGLAYNTIIPMLILVLVTIKELRRKNGMFFVILSAVWVIHFLIIYVSMPCGYFMYSLPLYILGYLTLIYMIGSVKRKCL